MMMWIRVGRRVPEWQVPRRAAGEPDRAEGEFWAVSSSAPSLQVRNAATAFSVEVGSFSSFAALCAKVRFSILGQLMT